MPATSSKQKKFMDAAAHNPSFAQQAGIPQSVAKDFSSASKGMKFGKGSSSRPDLQRINKPDTKQGKTELFKKGGNTMATKGVNPFAKFEKSGKDMETKGKGKEGSKKEEFFDRMQMKGVKKMAEGGMADMKQDKSMMQKAVNKHEGRLHKGATMTKLAKGGFTKSANGVAQRGLTKGTQVTMKKGGKC
jgi:hypothetical protein